MRADVKNDSIFERLISPHIIPDEGDETGMRNIRLKLVSEHG
jgi:hypothetical protein